MAITQDGELSVRQILNNGLGAISSINSAGVTVANTSTTVLAANALRKFAIIRNDSDEVVYLKLGSTALANKGIRLDKGTNPGNEFKIDALNLYQGIITAICASGSKVVTVTEGY